MAYNDNDGAPQRQRVEGNWVCSNPDCKAAITSLPFQPDPSRLNQLLCGDCHRARVSSFKRPPFRRAA